MWVADLAMNVPSHLHCLNKRLSTPFPQSNIAAAAGFTEFYYGFIEDTFCERQLCDFLSYTLLPQLAIDKFLGCPWSELLGEKSDFSKESLLTPRKCLRTTCHHFADIFKSIFLVWMLMYCDQTFNEFCFHRSNVSIGPDNDWRWTADKPLSEPMLAEFTDACLRHSSLVC